MNAAAVNRTGTNLLPKSLPSFNSVLLYEDSKSGERAWDFYEQLTRKFEGDFDFGHLMWSFSVLGDQKTHRLAVRSAADAHLVILSLVGNAPLPPSVMDWVERWSWLVGQRNSALVTLMGDKKIAETVAETHAYLHRILGSRKIDFFPHSTSVLRMSHLE
ncbi:MAG TPA: hypothetical protein VIT00_02990 [Terrimicrobiaceae bacterium]